MISDRILDKLKQESLFQVLEASDIRASSALFAYAKFLNNEPLTYDFFPLYLNILTANNQYAVDALIDGYVAEDFFNLVIVPNHFVLNAIFRLLEKHQSNALYEETVRVICGFLFKVYDIVEEGYRIYTPTVGDVNNIGKHLDESKDQDDKANRSILNILTVLSELDREFNLEKDKKLAGRQANKIRADFLDNKRVLLQAITKPILLKASEVDFGISPEQLQ